jgi:hypothetical protein
LYQNRGIVNLFTITTTQRLESKYRANIHSEKNRKVQRKLLVILTDPKEWVKIINKMLM